MSIERRQLLKLFASIGVTSLGASGLSSRIAAAAQGGERFPLGVASGSPAPDGFVIWTRLSPHGLTGSADVAWRVYEEGAALPVASGVQQAPPDFAHTVHVEVAGLRPGRWYEYEFSAMGATSPRGRVRTFPAQGAQAARMRFAYASCQRFDVGHYWAYAHMAREEPDFVVFLGDYIYERRANAKNAVRPHPVRHARTLEDYRDLYAGYRSDPLLQDMHRLCPWLVTWDDHEVQNNYTGDLSDIADPDFQTLRVSGYRAFYEHMPLRASAMTGALEAFRRDGRLRIYGRYDFGGLARLHMLDARQYRTPPLCAPKKADNAAACVDEQTSARTMLGPAQEKWLDQGLAQGSSAAWNIICQQTRFTTDAYPKGEGLRSASDRWDGYPDARKRVIGMIARHAPRSTLIMGGDIHRNWVADVHERPFDISSPVVAAEFTGTSLSSLPGRSQKSMDKDRAANPHCKLANSQHRGYGVVNVSADEVRVTLRTVDARAQTQPPLGTLADFRVRRGQGRVELLG
jgi:alkaline phosphatase D